MHETSCQPRVPFEVGLTPYVRDLLPFFPAEYPDESLGSCCSRFHIERGNMTTRGTYRELFGTSPFGFANLNIRHTRALANRLPGVALQNVRRLVHQTTSIPLMAFFTSRSIDYENDSATRRTTRKIGATKICVECMKADFRDHGTPYLRRSHLFPVVSVCWMHGRRLTDCCPSCTLPLELPKDLVLSPWTGCRCGYRFEETQDDDATPVSGSELGLAKFVHAVVNGLPESFIGIGLAGVFRDQAIARGFHYKRGDIDLVKLFSAVEAHYTPTFLESVDELYAKCKGIRWLLQGGCYSRAVPYSRNLLLANFLFDSGDSFLKAVKVSLDEHGVQTSGQMIPPDFPYGSDSERRGT